LAVEIGDAKEHLGLQIDNCHHTVIRGQQALFATFRCHDFLLVLVFVFLCSAFLNYPIKSNRYADFEILRMRRKYLRTVTYQLQIKDR
jgi:hypothetical protein